MTTRVYINIEAESALLARDEMEKLLGVGLAANEYAGKLGASLRGMTATEAAAPLTLNEAGFLGKSVESVAEVAAAQIVAEATAPDPVEEAPKPRRGRKPKADAALEIATMTTLPADSTPAQVAEAFAEIKGNGNISDSPEDRTNPQDDAETAAADAADEAAETAATKAATGGKLTLDDVRGPSGAYAKKYGVAAAQEDVRAILGKPLVELTDDELEDAIAKLTAAVADNPFKRADVTNGATQPADIPATKDDVNAALKRYALKYDGQNTDMANMPVTMADGPMILSLRFGEGIVKASLIPASPENYAQAVADIEEAIAKNPFNRTMKA